MFTIIGGDQKQYGPVSTDEIRQWIRDGRADGRTMALAQGGTEWKPLSAFPEFADLFPSAPGATTPPSLPGTAPTRHATPEEILAMDYDLDIGGCISRGWNLVKNNMGPVVGITFLVLIAASAVNYAINLIGGSASEDFVNSIINHQPIPTGGIGLFLLATLLNVPFQTVFLGGIYMYYLKLIRGEDASVGDAFSGFSRAFIQLAVLGIVQTILIWIGLALCLLPGIYLSVCWFFAAALIVDKGLGFWEAMMLSMKVVNKHWFMVFGMILVAGLVGFCGLFACCIGVFVTITIMYAAFMYAYEDIFGRKVSA